MANRPGADRIIDVGFFGRWRVIIVPLWSQITLTLLGVSCAAFLLLSFGAVPRPAIATPSPNAIALSDLPALDHVLSVALIAAPWIFIPPTLAALFVLFLLLAFFVVPPTRRWIIGNISNFMRRSGDLNLLMYSAALSEPLSRTLKAHALDEEGMSNSPYLLCRGACHTAQVYGSIPWLRWWSLEDPVDRKQSLSRRHRDQALLHSFNDVIVTKMADAMHLEVHPMLGEEIWFGDAMTDWDSQKTSLGDGMDIPLRHIQATPHARFIDHGSDPADTFGGTGDDVASVGERPKAKYIFFFCLANPIKDPIYVLPLRKVLHHLEARWQGVAVRFTETLQRKRFPLFLSMRSKNAASDVYTFQNKNERAILSKHAAGFRSGYDPNRIDLAAMGDRPEERVALSAFHGAIEAAAHEDEIGFMLRPGDVLVVNNYYAFHRRKEMRYAVNLPTLVPRRRWLRVYYAFSKPPEDLEDVGHHSRPRGGSEKAPATLASLA